MTLAVGRHHRLPRRYRGRDVFDWMDALGDLDRTIDGRPEADAEDAAGPVAIAVAERCWLAGEPQPAWVLAALTLVRRRHHRISEAELACYLQRAGVDAGSLSGELPEPWSSALAGDHVAAAAGWQAHRDEYEQAVETWRAGDQAGAADRLRGLGACAAVDALRRD